MEGMTASELAMIKKLAGNDALVRKKTTKKLKIWLTAISSKVPNSPDCRVLVENNFLRVWKALFYCMWMADKPLPQEQLAEQISDLVAIFSSKPIVFHLFVEWFFRTMAREWPYIDRFRMDKFMMLIRRFVRKTLSVIADQGWKLEALDGFLRIITVHIFNRHPEVKSTRSKARDPAPEVSPVGLQLHFIDIFLEELAKVQVNCGSIKSQKIMKILTPFIHELCHNDDDRILKDINDRIFCHLMRQSDAGIDYAEGVVEVDENYDESDDESVNGQSNGDMEEDEVAVHDGPLDPRAGAADVILPQLRIQYTDLATKLIEVGGNKSVRMKNRKMAYNLARQFKSLSSGDYPLALDVGEEPEPAIKRRDVEKAAKRLLEFDELTTPDKGGKGRKPKKVRQKIARQQQEQDLNNSFTSDNNGSESDSNSFYLKDDELLDHVGDNYMSYLEELHQKEEQANGDAEETDSDSDETSEPSGGLNKSFSLLDPDESIEDAPATPKKKKKAQEAASKPPKSPVVKPSPVKSPNSAKKKRRASIGTLGCINESPVANNNNNGDVNSNLNVTPKSGKKRYETVVEVEADEEINSNAEQETYVLLGSGSKKRNKRKLNDVETNSIAKTPGTPASAKRKRVSFVLARNLQHEHSDYQQSINRSPAIPFDSEKQPKTCGLLKSPAPSAASSSLFKNGLPSTPRRKSVMF